MNTYCILRILFLASLDFVYVRAVRKLYERKCDWRKGDCLTDEPLIKERCESSCSRTPAGCIYRVDKFGIGLKYQCHCFNVANCGFNNNGYCNKTKCFFSYSGPTCQRQLYYESFETAAKIYLDENVRHRRAVCDPLPKKIQFPHVFRINSVRFNIPLKATKPVYITSSKGNQPLNCTFKHNPPNRADDSPYTTVSCTGDISTRRLHINGDNVCIDNLEMSGCPRELYGLNCTHECRCKNGATCHQITGHCKEGCEFGRVGPQCQYQTYKNIALGQPAFQSSDFEASFLDGPNACNSKYLATASFAVDGNYNQNFQHKSCSRTQQESSNSYWYVKLDRNYTINQIRIYTHSFFSYSLNVFVGDKNNPCSQLCNKSKSTEHILHISCQRPLVGETVCIRSVKKFTPLTLCQVEVIQCRDGFYGPLCQHQCDNCTNKKCDQFSGDCIYQDGYKWNNISKLYQEPTWKFNVSDIIIIAMLVVAAALMLLLCIKRMKCQTSPVSFITAKWKKKPEQPYER